jgi:integrase
MNTLYNTNFHFFFFISSFHFFYLLFFSDSRQEEDSDRSSSPYSNCFDSDKDPEYAPSSSSSEVHLSGQESGVEEILDIFSEGCPSPPPLISCEIDREKKVEPALIIPVSSEREIEHAPTTLVSSEIEVEHAPTTPVSSEIYSDVEVEPKLTKTSKRIRNKDFCFYCETMVSTFARHVLRNHSMEFEVQQVMSCPLKSNRRKSLLTVLRKKGNFLASKIGIIRRVRSTKNDNDKSPLPCSFCLGLYSRSQLWKHRKKCSLNPGSSSREGAQAAGLALITSEFKADRQLREKIFPIMRPDEISLAAQKDTLICEYGSRYLRTHYKRHQFAVCSRKMRELSRLLLSAKKIEPSIKNLMNALRPHNFDTLVAAARVEAGHNKETNSFNAPTFAMNICTSLKECCEIGIYHVMKRKFCIPGKTATELEEELRTTIMLIQSNWNIEISHSASSCLNENKMNKITIVPLASDIKQFRDYLIAKGNKAAELLKHDSNDRAAYKTLCEVLYCRVILLCRKRVGELQRLTVELYQSIKQNQTYEEFEDVINPSEKILLKKFKRVVIPGKRRATPVLFSPDVQEKIKILIELRDKFVKESNPYLFPTIKSDSPIVGYKILKEHARKANLQTPDAFSSKSLRKHLATISQLFDMSEQDIEQLSSFMGHTVNIHRSEYRLPDNIFQTSKIAKLLLAMEKGEGSKFRGQSLDEIDMDLENNLLEDPESDASGDEDQIEKEIICLPKEKTPAPSALRTPEKSPIKTPTRREIVRWEPEEKHIVAEFFASHIKNKIPPKKKECERLIAQNPALQSKTWLKVKVFVQNIYTKKTKLPKK